MSNFEQERRTLINEILDQGKLRRKEENIISKLHQPKDNNTGSIRDLIETHVTGFIKIIAPEDKS